MSVKLNSIGGGSVTLQEPNTASARTLTLPDGDGTVQMRQLMTAQTASGTSVDFTGIPSWVKRITVMFNGVSTSGTSIPQIQLGATTYTTSGYAMYGSTIGASSVASTGYTSGFAIRSGNASATLSGSAIITFAGSNIYVCFGSIADTTNNSNNILSGAVTLSGALDRIRITTVNGTDTFDAGTINILYEG